MLCFVSELAAPHLAKNIPVIASETIYATVRKSTSALDAETNASFSAALLFVDARQDCTLIPNARDVGCEAGSCLVLSCKDGWLIGRDGKSCVKRAGMRR